jgi:segregation and condensation protein A
MNDVFTVQTSTYQGPLDLLLSLIQGRKLYINELSLAEVTDDYLKYISGIKEMPIDETAQFVLIASTLLLIKSRSLLPNLELTEEEEESIEELERRLAQYRLIKRASKNLGSIWGVNQLIITKGRRVQLSKFSPAESSLKTLHKAGMMLIEVLPVNAFKEIATVAPVVSLEEMIEDLHKRILSATRASFKSLTSKSSKEEVVIHFLALLELLKGEGIFASQHSSFGDIMVESESIKTPRYGDLL